jgi:hypothetical protein
VPSPAPKNGQPALDRSFDPSPDNPAVFRRYGVDHGHVPDPKTIPSQITTQLRRMGMIDKKFRVLPP